MAGSVNEGANSERSLLSDQAYELIKRDVLTCELAPGTRITESRMCDRYDLGRGPVRAALAQLVNEGLVVAVPQVGYTIREVTLADAQEMFDARAHIERFTIAKACQQRSDEDLEVLRRLAEVKCHIGDEESVSQYLAANHAFHLRVASAAGNSYFVESLQRLMDRMQLVMHLGHMVSDAANSSGTGLHIENDGRHAGLAELIAQRDVDQALALLNEHLESARARTLVALMDSPALQSVNLVAKGQPIGQSGSSPRP